MLTERARAIRGKKLIELLLSGNVFASELPQRLGLSIPELTELQSDPQIHAQLGALRQLDRWRERLMSDRWRMRAIARLTEIIEDRTAAADTVRRACVDLLALQLPEDRPPAATRRGAGAVLDDPASLAEARRVLEKAGRADDPEGEMDEQGS